MTMSSCAGTHAMAMRQPLSFDGVHNFLDTLFGDDLHAKRVKSLAGATLGAIQSASLAVGLIGQGLALARGRLTKHAVKQVDRLLSNRGIDVDALLVHWVPYVVGQRDSITVAMDWTEFDADGQATIMLSLLSRHGRATPLVWLTVDKAALKNRRNGYEYQVLVRLAEILPAEVRVRIVADRGFGDHKLYRVLSEELKFDFVIRFRGNIAVTATDGEARAAADWVGAGGRARTLRGAAVTAQAYPVATVVCVRAKGMKEPWCLAASTADEPARALIKLYAKRWEIEGGFRDTKDLRFGMGLGSMHVSTPDRRDRLWLINAFAVVLLTLLGAAGEQLGYDRHLKTNTSKRRTHSLFRQGSMLYELMPNMTDFLLLPLISGSPRCLQPSPCSHTCSVPSENEGSHETIRSSQRHFAVAAPTSRVYRDLQIPIAPRFSPRVRAWAVSARRPMRATPFHSTRFQVDQRNMGCRQRREETDTMPPLDKVYDYSQYGGLTVEKQDKVMTITLNAPESMNAFSAEMHYSMSRIWEDVQDDPEVNVVVLTGAGRAFSAGGNVIAMQQKIDRPELWDATSLPEAKRIIFRMLECDKPVIARLNGHAVGLGATVALMCDIIIAADTAGSAIHT